MQKINLIIVGAGQAGLGASYFLKQKKIEHVVLEQGRIGESWLSQRWDTFKLNTPNHVSTLPGLPYSGDDPEGFWTQAELIEYFQKYVDTFKLPIRTGVTVLSLDRANGQGDFTVRTRAGEKEEELECESVIIACGNQRVSKIPSIHFKLPKQIIQMHTADYLNPNRLPPGDVLIVGSGQSGCQIAEDLLSAGRTVYLCTSKVPRVPRRYRGRDTVDWFFELGIFDATYASLPDKAISKAPQPQISGVGPRGHSVSLQYLAKTGAVILGRLKDADESKLIFGDDAEANVQYADEFSLKYKKDVDEYLTKKNITLLPVEEDPADIPDPQAKCVSPIRELRFSDANISTVIWATGFGGDFSWVHLPILDDAGQPIHERGISPIRGIYFLGFPWLSKRKSGILSGIEEDAGYIVDAIARQLA